MITYARGFYSSLSSSAETDAQGLPTSIFSCTYQSLQAKETTCDTVKSESTCLNTKVNGENCAWCQSGAVGNACYSQGDAKSLPSSIFTCKYGIVRTYAGCENYSNKGTCLSGDKCAWCSSAAAGANCFEDADAKSLPSSIFQCTYPTYYLRSSI